MTTTLPAYLTLEDFKNIVIKNSVLEIPTERIAQVEKNHQFLKGFADKKIIYGVNTGFGPMAQYRIPDEDRQQLQRNLIRSHASGTGKILPPTETKAAILARLNTLCLAKSGVHHSVIVLLKELLNKNIIPLIYEHGGVGASGDLVQLAHLALVLIGEGEVFYQGERMPTSKAFEKENIQPIDIHIREGLGLMNGTSVMSGIGVVNCLYTRKLIEISVLISCALNEIVASYDDHYSVSLNEAKLHGGQQKIAKMMREILSNSPRTRNRSEHLYEKNREEEVFKDKVQEYYSLRCVPQIMGAVLDTLEYTEKVLENEINSANDNPIICSDEEQVYHGGNFHGDYVSLEMDKLKLVVTRLSMLAERQLNYLMNHKINDFLPPFANRGRLGFNFGLQGIQFTAVSTTAENQTLSSSMYVHSIPNNNDNQDIVSMGTNAALICRTVIDNAFQVLAIEAMAVVEAIEYLQLQGKISARIENFYREIREVFPAEVEDKPLYPFVEKITNQLRQL